MVVIVASHDLISVKDKANQKLAKLSILVTGVGREPVQTRIHSLSSGVVLVPSNQCWDNFTTLTRQHV